MQRNLKAKTEMQQFKITFFVTMFTLFVGINSARAGEPMNGELKREISRVISYPSGLQQMNVQEMVWVRFQVESCGVITILDIDSSNEEFKSYVMRKLIALRFSPEEFSGEEQFMKFTFRKENA